MAFTIKSLADGQLGTSKATIYTVPASTQVIVTYMAFFNSNATAQEIQLFIKRSGSSSREWKRSVDSSGTAMAQKQTFVPLENGERLTLSAADEIEAQTTTASAVDYFITGVEET